ncbi:sulfur carrier protein ThiS [Thiotrichales bacterium 19S3-7]|nr:sulfur carrier protein ThiS [Thiotrichales bacterium 19S3-7]MCF6801623.1 sulfur carrier protein ThiS [Thiotrichales bacterium 19S3-11]
MIEIIYNGQSFTVKAPCSVSDYLKHQKIDIGYSLITLNEIVLYPEQHTTTNLKNGDKLALITPLQGG